MPNVYVLVVQGITAASLFGTSDIVAQLLTKTNSYNWRRTLAVAVRLTRVYREHC